MISFRFTTLIGLNFLFLFPLPLCYDYCSYYYRDFTLIRDQPLPPCTKVSSTRKRTNRIFKFFFPSAVNLASGQTDNFPRYPHSSVIKYLEMLWNLNVLKSVIFDDYFKLKQRRPFCVKEVISLSGNLSFIFVQIECSAICGLHNTIPRFSQKQNFTIFNSFTQTINSDSQLVVLVIFLVQLNISIFLRWRHFGNQFWSDVC